jgi:hypothetical protein
MYALMIEHLVMGSWLSETPFGLVEFCDLRFVSKAEKILLAENWFLQAGNGAENTKEKSRQCFPIVVRAFLLGHKFFFHFFL